jgi:hypothetical protein
MMAARKPPLPLKPGKALAKALDPKCYQATEPYDKAHPSMGVRYVCFTHDGKRLAHAQSPSKAWLMASLRLTNRVRDELAKKVGLR